MPCWCDLGVTSRLLPAATTGGSTARSDTLRTMQVLKRAIPGLDSVLALSLPPGHDGKRDQESHNDDSADDVRRHGKRTGDIARVRPDQADNRAHDEQSDHGG